MNIKEIKTEKFEGLALLVPDDANGFEIQDNPVEGGKFVAMLRGNPDYACVFSPNLPYGDFKILGESTELTEDQCAEIVDSEDGSIHQVYGMCYKEYNPGIKFAPYFNNAIASFTSLMRSLEANTGTWLIIERLKET